MRNDHCVVNQESLLVCYFLTPADFALLKYRFFHICSQSRERKTEASKKRTLKLSISSKMWDQICVLPSKHKQKTLSLVPNPQDKDRTDKQMNEHEHWGRETCISKQKRKMDTDTEELTCKCRLLRIVIHGDVHNGSIG